MSLDIIPRITCIEHPGVVKNTDRAICGLGGHQAIVHAVNSNGQNPLELSFRSNDVFSHPIVSRSVTNAHSVLLRVKVKKATLAKHNGDLKAAMSANPNDYTAEPYAVINCNVRFRELADFQSSTLNSPFISKMRDTIFAGDLDAIKSLTITDIPLPTGNIDMPPSPRFSRIAVPFDYAYRQNPAVTAITDHTGAVKLINRSLGQRLYSKIVRWTDKSVPESSQLGPPPEHLVKYVEKLKEKFEERQIWTRRALQGTTSEWDQSWASHVKYALPYVAYTFKSGPWRATYTRYGLDPRKDKKYSKNQTEYFRATTAEEEQSKLESESSGYIFDGIHIPSGRSFQLCDVTDPVLVELINSDNMRDEPDEKDGWYKASTISKIRRIMKLKLTALWHHQPVRQMDVAKILEESSDEEDIQAVADEIANKSADEDMQDNEQRLNKLTLQQPPLVSETSANERQILDVVAAASEEGGAKLRELLGIVQQEDVEDNDDEYEIFDDDE
ncbi:RNA polymerase III transcription factor IIIC subunit-domain-containing protein [Lipomyces japonicus]|uniref:RNA polymerase III transcription factor IIIC subunit-domain-containing protein n=1 Tax=Lipomyces japonicus TaxID=56871 RepID=UPI0034CDD572